MRQNWYMLCMGWIALFALQACSSPQHKNIEPSLEGLWKLHSMATMDSNGLMTPYAGGMQGYLLYDREENMAIHLSYDGFEDTPMRFRNFTDTLSLDKLQYLVGSYHYLAHYRMLQDSINNGVREGIIEHHKFAHSNPNEWSTKVQRRFWLKGDTLRMQPVEKSNSSIRLTWVKTSDPD